MREAQLQQAALDDLAVNGGDSDFSILAGEDRLSSTAMESFTQAPHVIPELFHLPQHAGRHRARYSGQS